MVAIKYRSMWPNEFVFCASGTKAFLGFEITYNIFSSPIDNLLCLLFHVRQWFFFTEFCFQKCTQNVLFVNWSAVKKAWTETFLLCNWDVYDTTKDHTFASKQKIVVSIFEFVFSSNCFKIPFPDNRKIWIFYWNREGFDVGKKSS